MTIILNDCVAKTRSKLHYGRFFPAGDAVWRGRQGMVMEKRNLSDQPTAQGVFDIGINGRLTPSQFVLLGMQNVFGMTGMFVFPRHHGPGFQSAGGPDCLSLWHDFHRLRHHHHSAIGHPVAAADRPGAVCRQLRCAVDRRTFAERWIGRRLRLVLRSLIDLVRH